VLSDMSDSEYTVLRNWYTEWVSACRLLATFAFTAVGFTFVFFDLKAGRVSDPTQAFWIRSGVLLLGSGGVLSGLSIVLGFVWMDAISRKRMPTLALEIFLTKGVNGFKYLGASGWLVTLFALVAVLSGLTCLVIAILKAV